MNPDTVFITRYVTSHAETLVWYETFFGRPADNHPMPNCQEWQLGDLVLFQVIEDPDRRGDTSVAFHTADLDAETTRLGAAGLDVGEVFPVPGFDTLRYTECPDPEDVPLGLLDGE